MAHVAFHTNEGNLIAVVAPDDVNATLAHFTGFEAARKARVIGSVCPGSGGKAVLKNSLGASRILQALSGEQLPRIC